MYGTNKGKYTLHTYFFSSSMPAGSSKAVGTFLSPLVTKFTLLVTYDVPGNLLT